MLLKELAQIGDMNLQEDAPLAAPTPENIDNAYKVGDVMFDNVNGIGQTPWNQEVIYKGFVVFMSPTSFLDLAAPADRREDAKKLEALMRDGKAIGNPFLKLDIKGKDGAFKAAVVGHEGRARAYATREINGDGMIPIHVFLDDANAKNLSLDWFKKLREDGFIPEKKLLPRHVKIGKIFWQRKEV